MQDHEIREILGDDLHALVGARAMQVVSVVRISPLSSPTRVRAAFRLDLADGSCVKGRRLESAAAATRAVRLGEHLPPESFPRILAQQGCALISEWVQGVVLSTRATTLGQVRGAGAILRSLHAIAPPTDIEETTDRYPGGSWRLLLLARLDRLSAAGGLDASECARIIALADAHLPEAGAVRLVHGDVCPENVVLDGEGNLHIIDTDSMDMHAPEFDLARTWYRWPMSVEERQAFEEGYQAPAVLSSYHEHFLHWAMVVPVAAADFRLTQQLPGALEPLRRLRGILGDPDGRDWGAGIGK